jgi:serine phosphatase RsbU (regulator of sigma subunit)/anti-sigma regulatory factor (Ser/Thr protein kinase)
MRSPASHASRLRSFGHVEGHRLTNAQFGVTEPRLRPRGPGVRNDFGTVKDENGGMVQVRKRSKRLGANREGLTSPAPPSQTREIEEIEIPPGDTLETILVSAGGPVDLTSIEVGSDTIDRLREQGVELVVPLIGQGELLGALYLGHRLSDQPYSTDDRRLLGNLASQVAPAMKVAQLVREQQAEAKERERIEQELQVAALIQQTLLPKELPSINGWNVDAFYRPARAVGGDFYDFIELDGHRLGVVIGDVTDKGVPAALVMATSRSMLRAAALQHNSPSEVLAAVNENLVPEIPEAMFVTCLYAIIDTQVGEIVFANAGHNLPYVRTSEGVFELRATGMPLGLMPGMTYDERTHVLGEGDVMVLTSDGITEAHNPDGEMFGFSRLMGRVAKKTRDEDMCSSLVGDLETWTGADAEQEDDITLVVIRRTASASASAGAFDTGQESLLEFNVPSIEGNERLAIEKVAEAVHSLGLGDLRLERLKTAVGETVMNAIEHGNENNPELDVSVRVVVSPQNVTVRVVDSGGDKDIPDAVVPDLEAKIAGEQTPRGWGLFLTEQMVDEVSTVRENGHHIVELVMNREGEA